MTDDVILGHDHFRVHFQHKDLGTRHHVDVSIPFYTMQDVMSGAEGQAKRQAFKIVETWGRIGIAPHRLMLMGVTPTGRVFSDKMSQPEAE